MLTKSFQKTLAAKAHSLKPVVLIGAQGLTQAVHDEIEVQLHKHELIKIKINISEREIYKPMISELAQQHNASCIQSIGRTVVLYRERQED